MLNVQVARRPDGKKLLGGAFLALVGVAWLVAIWRPWSLDCQSGQCDYRVHSVLFAADTRFPAADLQGAQVERSTDYKGRNTSRTVIETTQGELSAGGSGNLNFGSEARVARIDAYAAHPQGTLHVFDPDWTNIAFCLFFLGFAGVQLVGAWRAGRRH